MDRDSDRDSDRDGDVEKERDAEYQRCEEDTFRGGTTVGARLSGSHNDRTEESSLDLFRPYSHICAVGMDIIQARPACTRA